MICNCGLEWFLFPSMILVVRKPGSSRAMCLPAGGQRNWTEMLPVTK